MQFKEKQLVWVAGRGPMRIETLPNPPKQTTVSLITPDGIRFWADPSDLIKLKPSTMDTFVGDFEGRFPQCVLLKKWQKEIKDLG